MPDFSQFTAEQYYNATCVLCFICGCLTSIWLTSIIDYFCSAFRIHREKKSAKKAKNKKDERGEE